MKFTVSIKDPDVLEDALREAANIEVGKIEPPITDKEEWDILVECRMEKAGQAISKWVKYGEYFAIEFDTEAGTATVKEPA